MVIFIVKFLPIESFRVVSHLQGRADELKGGAGFRGFCKGTVYGSRNQAILADMKGEMARAIDLFQVHLPRELLMCTL